MGTPELEHATEVAEDPRSRSRTQGIINRPGSQEPRGLADPRCGFALIPPGNEGMAGRRVTQKAGREETRDF